MFRKDWEESFKLLVPETVRELQYRAKYDVSKGCNAKVVKVRPPLSNVLKQFYYIGCFIRAYALIRDFSFTEAYFNRIPSI